MLSRSVQYRMLASFLLVLFLVVTNLLGADLRVYHNSIAQLDGKSSQQQTGSSIDDHNLLIPKSSVEAPRSIDNRWNKQTTRLNAPSMTPANQYEQEKKDDQLKQTENNEIETTAHEEPQQSLAILNPAANQDETKEGSEQEKKDKLKQKENNEIESAAHEEPQQSLVTLNPAANQDEMKEGSEQEKKDVQLKQKENNENETTAHEEPQQSLVYVNPAANQDELKEGLGQEKKDNKLKQNQINEIESTAHEEPQQSLFNTTPAAIQDETKEESEQEKKDNKSKQNQINEIEATAPEEPQQSLDEGNPTVKKPQRNATESSHRQDTKQQLYLNYRVGTTQTYHGNFSAYKCPDWALAPPNCSSSNESSSRSSSCTEDDRYWTDRLYMRTFWDTNLKVLVLGDSVAIQMGSILEEAIGANQTLVLKHMSEKTGPHHCVTGTVASRALVASWRVTGVFHERRRNKKLPNNVGGGWSSDWLDEFWKHVQNTTGSNGIDVLVYRIPSPGWQPPNQLKSTAYLVESLIHAAQYFRTPRIVLQTSYINNNVREPAEYVDLLDLNRRLRRIVTDFRLFQEQERQNFNTNQSLLTDPSPDHTSTQRHDEELSPEERDRNQTIWMFRQAAQRAAYLDARDNTTTVTLQHLELLDLEPWIHGMMQAQARFLNMTTVPDPGDLLRLVKIRGKFPPHTAQVCAERKMDTPQNTNDNKAANLEDSCTRRNPLYFKDGQHWCTPSLGGRWAAALACVIQCLLPAVSSSSTSANVTDGWSNDGSCARDCNERLMSQRPIRELSFPNPAEVVISPQQTNNHP